MGVYRRVWTCLVAVTGAAGLWAAIIVWSVGGAIFFFLFAGVSVACVRLLMAKEDEHPPWRRALATGVAVGAALVPAGGLVARFGFLGLAVVAMLAVVSPFVLDRVAGRHRTGEKTPPASGHARAHEGDRPRASEPGVPALTPVATPSLLEAPWMKPPAESMDDATLCFAWRTSYVALQRPLPLPSRIRIVERRQEFLDEFERRNARGFSAWLASGARAAGDPSKYIVGSVRRPKDRHDQH